MVSRRGKGQAGRRQAERWKKRQSPLDACTERKVAPRATRPFRNSAFNILVEKSFSPPGKESRAASFDREIQFQSMCELVAFRIKKKKKETREEIKFSLLRISSFFLPFTLRMQGRSRKGTMKRRGIVLERPVWTSRGGKVRDVDREIDRSIARAEAPFPVGANFDPAERSERDPVAVASVRVEVSPVVAATTPRTRPESSATWKCAGGGVASACQPDRCESNWYEAKTAGGRKKRRLDRASERADLLFSRKSIEDVNAKQSREEADGERERYLETFE